MSVVRLSILVVAFTLLGLANATAQLVYSGLEFKVVQEGWSTVDSTTYILDLEVTDEDTSTRALNFGFGPVAGRGENNAHVAGKTFFDSTVFKVRYRSRGEWYYDVPYDILWCCSGGGNSWYRPQNAELPLTIGESRQAQISFSIPADAIDITLIRFDQEKALPDRPNALALFKISSVEAQQQRERAREYRETQTSSAQHYLASIDSLISIHHYDEASAGLKLAALYLPEKMLEIQRATDRIRIAELTNRVGTNTNVDSLYAAYLDLLPNKSLMSEKDTARLAALGSLIYEQIGDSYRSHDSMADAHAAYGRALSLTPSDEVEAKYNATETGTKSPFLAGLMSAIIPGAGFVYNGHLWEGVGAFAAVGASYLIFSAVAGANQNGQIDPSTGDYTSSSSGADSTTVAVAALAIAVYAINIILSVGEAEQINDAAREASDFDSRYSVAYDPRGRGLSLNYCLKF